MVSRFPLLLLIPFLLTVVHGGDNGLVNTEDELVQALSTKQRIVLGSSITISKELPTIERAVLLLGHSKSCKQRGCYIDAQGSSRHITVRGQGRLYVHNLEFRNGKFEDADGGSILVMDGGYIETNRATFVNNNVNLFSLGGAISLVNLTSAKIYDSTFINNTAGFGGAVGVSEDSQVAIRSSVFHKNYAVFSGGGVEFLGRGSGIVAHTTFENNSASVGGALTVHDSKLNICEGKVLNNVGSLDGPNVMSEEDSSVTLCRFSSKDVVGPSVEDCGFCNSLGPVPGIKGDPHIRGPHGETYDFHGVPEATYSLISDVNLHLNMRTASGNNVKSRGTYIKEIGLIYMNQTVWISALTKESTPFTSQQGELFVNMEKLDGGSNLWSFAYDLTVERTRNEVIVEVPGSFRMAFKIVRAMYRVQGPGFNFLNLQVDYLNTTNRVDGIFGRLYKKSIKAKFRDLVDTDYYRVPTILSTSNY